MKYFWKITNPDLLTSDEKEKLPSPSVSEMDERLERIMEQSTIDAGVLSEILFPKMPDRKESIFISHSHAYVNDALAVKDFFTSKGISCFVDGEVWADVYYILKVFQKRHAKPLSENTYSLSDCNMHAAHMYLMLATALMREISQADAFLYLGTGKSVDKLNSPWLHYELSLASSLKKAGDKDEKDMLLENFSKLASVQFEYEVGELLSDATEISLEALEDIDRHENTFLFYINAIAKLYA
ncbi:MAG: hypothetical protein J1E42_02555 [Akkermansiaceae bacterium]|nr:hypothetical protein [Akkermansiaceae bacterium]